MKKTLKRILAVLICIILAVINIVIMPLQLIVSFVVCLVAYPLKGFSFSETIIETLTTVIHAILSTPMVFIDFCETLYSCIVD